MNMLSTRGLRRVAAPQPRQARQATYRFPSPLRGWVTNENLALSEIGGAYVLDNFFPGIVSLRVRGGSVQHATTGANPVESMMAYKSGATQKMFAASNGEIFDITSPASATVAPAASVTGQTANYYSSTMFSTVGGDYMIAVNGADRLLLFDGTTFEAVDTATHRIAYDAETGAFTEGLTITGGTSSATAVIVEVIDNGTDGYLRVNTVSGTFQDDETITDTSTGSAAADIPDGIESLVNITGVDTSTFAHVWSYRNRLYFVGAGKSAWYLPVDSVGGAAAEVSLNGVFKRGGNLLMGGTWSLDAGDGLDDKCVFISDRGEVAVFEGNDPSDANTWRLVGLYETAEPLGKNATIKAGGDFLIATVSGLVPISSAVNTDKAAISLQAVSRTIEPTWKSIALSHRSRPWEMVKWPEKNMALVSIPIGTTEVDVPDEWGSGIWGTFVWGGGTAEILTEEPFCWIVNLETGAWARYTGWDTQCFVYHDGAVFFGTVDGKVMRAESSGSDNGEIYVSRYASLFDGAGSDGVNKHFMMARPVWNYGRDFNYTVSVSTNYSISSGVAPGAASPAGSSTWDSAIWDTGTWDAGTERKIKALWHSIGRTGHAVAAQVQVTNGSTPTPDAELVSIDITYEDGGLVV